MVDDALKNISKIASYCLPHELSPLYRLATQPSKTSVKSPAAYRPRPMVNRPWKNAQATRTPRGIRVAVNTQATTAAGRDHSSASHAETSSRLPSSVLVRANTLVRHTPGTTFTSRDDPNREACVPASSTKFWVATMVHPSESTIERHTRTPSPLTVTAFHFTEDTSSDTEATTSFLRFCAAARAVVTPSNRHSHSPLLLSMWSRPRVRSSTWVSASGSALRIARAKRMEAVRSFH